MFLLSMGNMTGARQDLDVAYKPEPLTPDSGVLTCRIERAASITAAVIICDLNG